MSSEAQQRSHHHGTTEDPSLLALESCNRTDDALGGSGSITGTSHADLRDVSISSLARR